MTGEGPKQPAHGGSSGDDLREALDARLARGDDPFGALADLLSGRHRDGHELLSLRGEVLGGYRLMAVLGHGGMGVTWAGLADDGQQAAIKVVGGLHGAAGERFANECRILQSLEHPAIVHYRDHGVSADGRGFLVMDLIEGTDLEVLFADVLLPEPRTPAATRLLANVEVRGAAVLQHDAYRRRMLRLLATVADGLAHSHRQGVVHRDLKPGNVLVTAGLDPVLIDFGLSRDLGQKVSLTRSGAAMGTLAYMAPEQLGRDPGRVGPPADLFALGLLLYRAMTGSDLRGEVADVLDLAQRPFQLDAQQGRGLPVPVQAVLYRCLERRPERRYASSADLAADLRACAGNGVVAARRPGVLVRFLRSPSGRRTLAASLLLVTFGLLLLAWPTERHAVFFAGPERCTLRIDGGPAFADNGEPVPLLAGRHEVEVTAPSLLRAHRRRFEVRPGRNWVPLLLARSTGSFPFEEQPGEPEFLLAQVLTGATFDDRRDLRLAFAPADGSGGGRTLQPQEYWVRLPAERPVRIEAELQRRDGPPLREAVTVRGGAGDFTDVVLLPKRLLGVPGRVRATLATVFSPLPDGLVLEQAGTLAWLAESKGLAMVQDRTFTSDAGLTPAAAGVDATAVARFVLPMPCRSLVVMFRAEVGIGGTLQLAYRLDQGPSVPLDLRAVAGAGDYQPPAYVLEVQSPVAVREFALHASLRQDANATPRGTTVRFLASMVAGGHVDSDPPCLALVGDPEPIALLHGKLAPGEHRLTALGNQAPPATVPTTTPPLEPRLRGDGDAPLNLPMLLVGDQDGDGCRDLLVGGDRGGHGLPCGIWSLRRGELLRRVASPDRMGALNFGARALVVDSDVPGREVWLLGQSAYAQQSFGGGAVWRVRPPGEVDPAPWTIDSRAPITGDSGFGDAMCDLGDLGQAGAHYVAVSASQHPAQTKQGLVQVRAVADGAVLVQLVGPEEPAAVGERETHGSRLVVAPMAPGRGDGDGDGIDDLLTLRYLGNSDPGRWPSRLLRVDLWSGAELRRHAGAVLAVDRDLRPLASRIVDLPRQVTGLLWAGDLDGRPGDEVLVALAADSRTSAEPAELRLWAPASDAWRWQQRLPPCLDVREPAVPVLGVPCRVPDLDGDGVPDFAVGDQEWRATGATPWLGRGQVVFFAARTGALLQRCAGPLDDAGFGSEVLCGDDLDGDGRPELVVKSTRADGGELRGNVYVLPLPTR